MLKLLASLITQGYAAHMARARIKRSLAQAAIVGAGLLAVLSLGLIGLGFAITALFLWLDQVVSTPLAALLVAALMFLVAGFIVLGLRLRSARSRQPAEGGGEKLVGSLTTDLADSIERQPRRALLVALALGVGVGLWMR